MNHLEKGGEGERVVNQTYYKEGSALTAWRWSAYSFDICTVTRQKHAINMSVHKYNEVVKVQWAYTEARVHHTYTHTCTVYIFRVERDTSVAALKKVKRQKKNSSPAILIWKVGETNRRPDYLVSRGFVKASMTLSVFTSGPSTVSCSISLLFLSKPASAAWFSKHSITHSINSSKQHTKEKRRAFLLNQSHRAVRVYTPRVSQWLLYM